MKQTPTASSRKLKKRVVRLFLNICSILLIVVSTAVLAEDKKPSPPPQTKAEAAQQAQQKVNGRVLKVEQKPDAYRVKVLQKSGRVVSVDVDKKSGKVTKEKKDE